MSRHIYQRLEALEQRVDQLESQDAENVFMPDSGPEPEPTSAVTSGGEPRVPEGVPLDVATVEELRAELRTRGLSASGSRQQLVDRLREALEREGG